jgi:O-antigen ligase
MVIHFIVTAKGIRDRFFLLLGAIAIAAAMIQTGSRGAVIGLLLTLSVYAFFAFYRAWRSHPSSLIAATGLFAYPMGAAAMIVLVFAWGRLRGMVIGNGSQNFSNQGRAAQWDVGLPKVWSHPLGHGANRSGAVVGWSNAGGEFSIDSLYLSMLLDFGPIGFVVFLLLILIPAYLGARIFINTRDSEASLVGPLAVGLINFTVYAAVLSSLLQWPIVSIFIGLILGTYWRTRQDDMSKVAGKAALFSRLSPKLAKSRH